MSETLQSYEEELNTIEEIYHLLPEQHARRMTIPAIFSRSYDENFISDYLAYILNPEINGIGIAPLRALLSLIDEDGVDDNSEVVIDREYTFDDGGRIDFLIRIDDELVLGIENKITAGEGFQQTLSYEKAIENKFPDLSACLVFLTPQGSSASSSKFKSISYRDLYDAFRGIPFSPLPDIHKSIIWEDFLAHLEDYIVMGNKTLDLQEKTLLYLKHKDLIEDLSQSLQQDAENRKNYVRGKVDQLFSGWDFFGRPSDLSHWYAKKNWYLDEKTYVFAQFLMVPMDLVKSQSIQFMIGVYPVNDASRPFIDFFLANYRGELTAYCERLQMEAFFKRYSVNYVFARKFYPFNPMNSSDLDDLFTNAREEITQLEEIFDKALQAYADSKTKPS